MSIDIGLDIGAVSLKLAAIGATTDRGLFEALAKKSETFFSAEFPPDGPYAGRPLLLSRYRRIQGSPIQCQYS